MPENSPENLEPDNDIDKDDTTLEDFEPKDLVLEFKEITGEKASDTLKRARSFIKQLNEKINKLKEDNNELEDKLEKGLLSEEETDASINKNLTEIKSARDLIESIPDMAKEQIARNKRLKEDKGK